jgi:hypothetical protein
MQVEHGFVAGLRRPFEGWEHQRLPLRFDKGPERDERLWPPRALIDRSKIVFQPHLGIALLRQLGNGAKHYRSSQLFHATVLEHSGLVPACDPHLATLTSLEQIS